MRLVLLLMGIIGLALSADSQSIKMKIAGVTPTTGEEVIAFETSDTTQSVISGGGGASPSAMFEMVKIKKLKAASTNELFKRSINGAHFPDATFEFYDNNAVLFYTIVIKDISVNHFSYLSPECTGCSKLYHQVWFDYKQIEATDAATGNAVKYNRATRAFY